MKFLKKSAVYLFLFTLNVMASGCASTVTSEVTSFNKWPQNLGETNYYFETPKANAQSLEYQTYQDLINQQLFSIGLDQVEDRQKATLEVSMNLSTEVSQMQQGPTFPPFWYGPGFYDPFWYNDSSYQRQTYQVYKRRLTINITRIKDQQKLWETTVENTSANSNSVSVMPYLIKSAFVGFPGENGIPHSVKLQHENR